VADLSNQTHKALHSTADTAIPKVPAIGSVRRRTFHPIVDRRYLVPFAIVTCLFFSWAFAAALNDILIRQFQKALDLTRTQSSMIQLAFYIGYFCAALPAGLVIRRAGYKRTILIGLALYALGAFLFYPAADAQRFGYFLIALYIIAFGLAFLETAANPYISILGQSDTASARLNLAQSFYGLGAILGPIVGGLFIFSGIERTPEQLSALSALELAAYRSTESAAVQGPYLSLGLGISLLALLVALTPFPVFADRKGISANPLAPRRSALAVLRHKRLRWAVVTQFFYVGAQVSIWSFFIDFSKALMPNVSEKIVAFLLSASLGMLMIGRFSGALMQARIAPARLLTIYAAANIVLCLLASTASGWLAVGPLWLTSFFMSIMFPTIFAIGIEDLGDETEMGSSFLIMSIIGGAVLPPLTGLMSDRIGGIHHAMIIPALCFGICLAYGLKVQGLRRNNGT
jgi:FHS family L-fucose permease-like MFS transporter